MNMKNTIILLIFLLAILGLILGVELSQTPENKIIKNNSIEVINEYSNGTITIQLKEKRENSFFDKLFN